MLNLTHVRSFLVLAEARSLRAGAGTLGLSPSTALEHLRQLEAALGAALLLRQAGNTRLTAAGARFLPLAQAMVATALRAREHIRLPHVVIAASSNIGTYLLPTLMKSLEQQTGRAAHLWIGTNMQVVDRLERGEADLALTEWWEPRDNYLATLWRIEPLKIIVAPHHRWAGREAVEPEELVEEWMLGGEPGTGTGRILREALDTVAGRLRLLDGFGSTEAVKRAVRCGQGISIVMASAIEDERQSGTLVALEVRGVQLEKRLMMVRSTYLPASAPASRLIGILEQNHPLQPPHAW